MPRSTTPASKARAWTDGSSIDNRGNIVRLPRMSNADTFPAILARLDKGERVIVSPAFLDWAEAQGRTNIATVPNPDRVGTLDAYVACIYTDTVRAIRAAKGEAGPDGYLWVHDSGDVILWPSEDASEDDNGADALERWHVTATEVDVLVGMGIADEVA